MGLDADSLDLDLDASDLEADGLDLDLKHQRPGDQ